MGPGFNPWLAVTIVPAIMLALVGGGVAAFSVTRHRDRGLLVFVPLAAAFLVAAFVVGEVVSSH